ncbi:MAG: hypothetical protein ABI806_19785 [Candidatus Solibacter sp.]
MADPGQAKAVNQDGSLNGNGSKQTSDKPAPPASVISVYATMGGRSATVTWAGLAPGLIGTYQVNILVPAATPSGTARLAQFADGIGSQTGVTIEVR